jgi:DNA-binding NarL/FixJ family response regulator
MKVIQQLQSPAGVGCSREGVAGAKLTSREIEVLELMADGLSTEQIAGRMFIGKVTVRTHVSNVLKKLRVPDRDAAVRLVRAQS